MLTATSDPWKSVENNGQPLALQRFLIGLATRPTSHRDQLPRGSYEITLAVTGSNADARYVTLCFHFDGRWTPLGRDEDQLKVEDGPKLVDPPSRR